MLNGKPAGAYRQVSAKGEIRANIHSGTSAEKYQSTDVQKQICEKIGLKLAAEGL
jgi:glutathione synthase